MTKKLKREENPRILTPVLQSIVILDGERHELDAVRAAFRAACLEAEIATVSSEAALSERLANSAPDLVLLDQDLGDGRSNGLVILRSVREAHPELPIVVVAETGDVETARRAVEAGATDFLTKPIDSDALQALLAHVARRERDRNISRALDVQIDSAKSLGLVGNSRVIRELRDSVSAIASCRTSQALFGTESSKRTPRLSGKRPTARFSLFSPPTFIHSIIAWLAMPPRPSV